MKKKLFNIILTTTMVASLAACGAKDSAAGSKKDSKDYVYVPEYISLDNEESEEMNIWYTDYGMKDDILSFTRHSFDQNNGEVNNVRCGYSLADGSITESSSPVWEKDNLMGCIVEEDGTIYTLENDYSAGKTTADGSTDADRRFCKYSSAGDQVLTVDISEAMERGNEYIYPSAFMKDSKGMFYVCVETGILLLNENGEEQGYIETPSGWLVGTGMDADEKVYFTYYEMSGSGEEVVLAQIDSQTKKIGNKYTGAPNTYRNFISIDGGFLFYDDSMVYQYDMESQTYEEVLSWIDCSINGSYVEFLSCDSEGNLVAVINDWDTNVTELVKLVKTEASKVVQKEELILGTLYENQQLQAAAVAFNKANEQYKITVRTYLDTNNWSETSYQDAITALNNDILSGDNCPDILELSELNKQQMAAKGVLVDLATFLEKSDKYSKEDFLEPILDRFTYDGVLVTIPATFEMSTIVGKTSVVGEEMGWTMKDLMELAEKYPDAEIFSGMMQSTMLQYGMICNQDSFVDWSNATCHFDSEEFKDLLEFAAMFPEEINWETYDGGVRIEDRLNNKLLLDTASIYDFNEIQMYPAMFGEDVTFIGFPTADGSVGCMMNASTQYGITVKSEHKDAAWEFIECFLDSSADSMFSWGFPTLKEDFENKVAEITKVEYLYDENGELVLDENGEPIPMNGTSSVGWDDWEYTYHIPTEDEIAQIRELIAVAKPMSGIQNDELMKIVMEEAEGYFKGQKSLDDVVNVIQSRAQIYVSENS